MSNADSMWFNAASNGMQFPPHQQKTPLSYYNDRLIKVEDYYYSSTVQIPTSVLDIHMYDGQWSGGLDVGFTYNMPLFEQSYKCGDCTNTTQENDQKLRLEVQGKQYVHASVDSEYSIGIQPDTGFTQQANKQSTMVLLMSYFTNPDQEKQPAPYQALPLPDLDILVGIHVPLYDMKETMFADQAAFLDTVGYVADNQSQVRTITVCMIVFCVLFFVACVVCAVINKMDNSKKDKEGQVRQSEGMESQQYR